MPQVFLPNILQIHQKSSYPENFDPQTILKILIYKKFNYPKKLGLQKIKVRKNFRYWINIMSPKLLSSSPWQSCHKARNFPRKANLEIPWGLEFGILSATNYLVTAWSWLRSSVPGTAHRAHTELTWPHLIMFVLCDPIHQSGQQK